MEYQLTLVFINDLSEDVYLIGGLSCCDSCADSVLVSKNSMKTLIQTRITNKEINISDIQPFPSGCLGFYEESKLCDFGFTSQEGETGIGSLDNYENQRELSADKFEITYRLNDSSRDFAQECD